MYNACYLTNLIPSPIQQMFVFAGGQRITVQEDYGTGLFWDTFSVAQDTEFKCGMQSHAIQISSGVTQFVAVEYDSDFDTYARKLTLGSDNWLDIGEHHV